jgi:hypothetical protein
MAELHYCWKCRKNVWMLDDAEWAVVEPLMQDAVDAIKEFRKTHNATLAETLTLDSGLKTAAQDAYFRITGVRERDPNKLYHHHRSYFGPLCPQCKKFLRTPLACFCAECGHQNELM